MTENVILLDTEIYPMGHQIRVEDYGTDECPAMSGPSVTPIDGGKHVLFVYTMTADDADYVDAKVRVRVLCGEEEAHLGNQIYDGTLTLTTPLLAIGDVLDDPEYMKRVPLQRDGVLALRIFTNQTIANISGPNEITILLPPESAKSSS